MACAASAVRFEWPEMRLPIYLIVDDPAPCLNLAHFEQYFETHQRAVPNSFTDQWADLVEEFGVAGKFTVLPVPAGIGRIDRSLPGVASADLTEFLRITRERIQPRMDICIEFLTHFLAWDIREDRPLDYTEKTMGPFTSRSHLAEYFAFGLRILRDVGLEPTGATSPGAALREVEWAYEGAIREAVQGVCGLPIAWYFLHVDTRSPVVLPRLMSLERQTGSGCVSILSAGSDPFWRSQFGEACSSDALLTETGDQGRLAELFRNGSPMGFHTHWQSLFSNGSAAGLQGMRSLLQRIRDCFGQSVRWTRCSELARLYVAQASAQVRAEDLGGALRVRIDSPVACPAFTLSAPIAGPVRSVRWAGAALRELPDGAGPIPNGAYRCGGGRVAWCADLPEGATRVEVELR